MGAVGGYIGAHLAWKYKNSDEIEIIVISSKKTVEHMLRTGLKLITPTMEIVGNPAVCTAEPGNLAALDYLFCTVKSYDLEEAISTLGNSVDSKTIIVPLLNGVDAKERILKIHPSVKVAEGCIYLVARRIEPGVIKELGNIHKLFFGSDSLTDELSVLHKLVSDSGIECYLSANMQQTLWEKFFFTAGMANTTSYYDQPIGAIVKDKERSKILRQLLVELQGISAKMSIKMPSDIIDSTIKKMEGMPADTTSSMHSDFQKGNRTEYRSITGFPVELGRKHNIPTPTFDMMLKEFASRN